MKTLTIRSETPYESRPRANSVESQTNQLQYLACTLSLKTVDIFIKDFEYLFFFHPRNTSFLPHHLDMIVINDEGIVNFSPLRSKGSLALL